MPSQHALQNKKNDLDTVRNYQLSTEELTELINKKKEQKIKNQDKNINITYELSALQEEFNAAKQKFEETKKAEFLNK